DHELARTRQVNQRASQISCRHSQTDRIGRRRVGRGLPGIGPGAAIPLDVDDEDTALRAGPLKPEHPKSAGIKTVADQTAGPGDILGFPQQPISAFRTASEEQRCGKNDCPHRAVGKAAPSTEAGVTRVLASGAYPAACKQPGRLRTTSEDWRPP